MSSLRVKQRTSERAHVAPPQQLAGAITIGESHPPHNGVCELSAAEAEQKKSGALTKSDARFHLPHHSCAVASSLFGALATWRDEGERAVEGDEQCIGRSALGAAAAGQMMEMDEHDSAQRCLRAPFDR